MSERVAALLAQAIADPYSIFDTSEGDPRIHAVRRIALAAVALGLDAESTGAAARTILCRQGDDDEGFTALDLSRLADALEEALDSQIE